jgi:uncharacterized membrane protein
MPATSAVLTDSQAAAAKGARQRWPTLLAPPASPAGLIGAAMALAASLTPGLYPRPWLVQGALSGVAVAIGYGLGGAAGSFARRGPRAQVRTARSRVAVAAAAGIALAALWWNAGWQADVRDLMGLGQGVAGYLAVMMPVAVLTGFLLILFGRAVRSAHRGYLRLLHRLVPHRWLRTVRILVVVLLLVPVLNGLLLGWTMGALDAALVAGDARIDPDVAQPSVSYRAGGPGSLIRWDSLSAPGRAFVAQGPTVAELEAFGGGPATPPIRVYAGVGSAATDVARARLAVAELDRMGAFERAVLVVATPTGSGSINPYAIDPLEYMYRGDTATVAMQYGHLPSWVTMAGNQERAQQGARALFDAVTQRLDEQPPDARPKLLVYAESLGSFGAEANFADLDDVRTRIAGMLLVGPTRGNLLWRDLTANRDPGSPIWQPLYGGGELVRFGSDGASLMQPGGNWPFPRVAYLQHATDPITWHSPTLLLERPEWLEVPRGPDISDRMPYLPVLTAWQLTVDMALAETAPLGHGHMYGPEQAEAWALIAPPTDWTPQQTRKLVALLAPR